MKGQITTTKTTPAPTGTMHLALLTFTVAGQKYGLPVTSVQRIIEMVTITELPGAPEIIQGVINFHGKTVAVMDLRRRFGQPSLPYGLHTPIILVDVAGGSRALGLVVDNVEEVMETTPEDLEMTETIVPAELTEAMASRVPYLAGIAKVDRRLILVLNVQALLTSREQAHLATVLAREI